jgi:hypothetical protein
MRAVPLVSRLLAVLAAVGVLGLAWWFVGSLFAPVEVPAPLPSNRTAVRFDPAVDVSRRPAFNALRPLVSGPLDIGVSGRLNPFLPPSPAERAAGGGAAEAASSTRLSGSMPSVAASSSLDIPVPPSSTLPTP